MKQAEDQNRRETFCMFMAQGYPPEDAARRAGFPPTGREIRAAKLLGEKCIRRRIRQLTEELNFRTPAQAARAGLERLAFGSADGAASLLYEEGDALSPHGDLFHVAEVKRPKSGGVEIKFCDRLRALSMLAKLDVGQEDPEGSLLAALGKSAAGIGGEDIDAV